MIQNRSAADRTVEGNLEGEDIKMGVADMAHILNVVTDLYSDRELACIREYSTNALDAHIEAGITSPIEVTTPSALSPFLTIRDYGVGLDLEDIRDDLQPVRRFHEAQHQLPDGHAGPRLQVGPDVRRSVHGHFRQGRRPHSGGRFAQHAGRFDEGRGHQRHFRPERHDGHDSGALVQPDRAEGQGVLPLLGRGHGQAQRRRARVHARREAGDGRPLHWSRPLTAVAVVRRHGRRSLPGAIEHGLGYGKAIVAFVGIGEVDFAPSREGLMDTDTTTATLRRSRRVPSGLPQSIRTTSQGDRSSALGRCVGSPQGEWRDKVAKPHDAGRRRRSRASIVPDSYKCRARRHCRQRHGRKMNAHSNYRKGPMAADSQPHRRGSG
jgi:hypothetical protein